jgi:hypothetical protein
MGYLESGEKVVKVDKCLNIREKDDPKKSDLLQQIVNLNPK